MNRVILKGNLGCDPQIQLTQHEKEIATFPLATNTLWREASGEWEEYTDWHRVIVFREATVKWIKDVLKKGDCVYLEGKLSYHQRKDKDGQSCSISYVVIWGQEGRIEHLRSKKPLPAQNQLEATPTLLLNTFIDESSLEEENLKTKVIP